MEEYGDYNLQGLHQLGEIINLHELYSNMGVRDNGAKLPLPPLLVHVPVF